MDWAAAAAQRKLEGMCSADARTRDATFVLVGGGMLKYVLHDSPHLRAWKGASTPEASSHASISQPQLSSMQGAEGREPVRNGYPVAQQGTLHAQHQPARSSSVGTVSPVPASGSMGSLGLVAEFALP